MFIHLCARVYVVDTRFGKIGVRDNSCPEPYGLEVSAGKP